jgi:hypothetical protein
MSSTKDQLVQNVKAWLNVDKEIKKLQNLLKEQKTQKIELTNMLVEIMKTNDIDCFDITGGKIMYTQNRVKSALNKKHLMDCLDKYFENNPNINTNDVSKFIMDSREIKINESIKHKVAKP